LSNSIAVLVENKSVMLSLSKCQSGAGPTSKCVNLCNLYYTDYVCSPS